MISLGNLNRTTTINSNYVPFIVCNYGRLLRLSPYPDSSPLSLSTAGGEAPPTSLLPQAFSSPGLSPPFPIFLSLHSLAVVPLLLVFILLVRRFHSPTFTVGFSRFGLTVRRVLNDGFICI